MPTGVKFNCRRGSLSLRRFGHVLLSLQKRFEAFASGVWDNNGSIENEELRGFLKDLLELVKKDYDAADLEEFEETILQGVDYNQDGKINRKELTMILLALAKHSSEEESK
ncbi:Calbindin-32 [Polyplax serrata]|uniref:Calbindin-32 n=1 Tax=Polyplax serrata TaxID=468196 RepID=A0ABR1AM35_POLSC